MASSDHNNLKNDQENLEWVTLQIFRMGAVRTEGKTAPHIIEMGPHNEFEPTYSYGPS